MLVVGAFAFNERALDESATVALNDGATIHVPSDTATIRRRARLINRGQLRVIPNASARCARVLSVRVNKSSQRSTFLCPSSRFAHTLVLMSCAQELRSSILHTKTLGVHAQRARTCAKCRRFVRVRARCRKNVVLTRGNATPSASVRDACVTPREKVAQNQGDDRALIFSLQCYAWLTTSRRRATSSFVTSHWTRRCARPARAPSVLSVKRQRSEIRTCKPREAITRGTGSSARPA